MNRLQTFVLGVAVLASSAVTSLAATVVTTTNPGLSSAIGARIRWGATGFEASVFDSSPLNQSPTLNPVGTPAWTLNYAYAFAVTFDTATGTETLSVDFNKDNSFATSETISRSTFATPGLTSYAGYGFQYLQISGNESGTGPGRSTLTNLVINGTSFGTITPGGTLLDTYFQSASGGPLGPVTITGNLTFTVAGTTDERPSWNFRFISPQRVPLPGALALLLTGLPGGLGAMFYLRRKQQDDVQA